MKKKKEMSMHDLAIALCEGRNVWFQNHTIRMRRLQPCFDGCDACELDCLCTQEMCNLCSECAILSGSHCYLELVEQKYGKG